MAPRVVTYGDLVVDLLLPIPSLPLRANEHQLAHSLSVEPGGMGNFLIMASRLGLAVRPLGAMGADAYQEIATGKLRQEGVDTSGIILQPGKDTTLALVFMSDAQEHVFLGVLGSAQITPVEQAALWKDISTAQVVYLNGYAFLEAHPPQLVVDAMKHARRSGAQVYFDPGPQAHGIESGLIAEAIASSHGLMLTHEEATMIVGEMPAADAARALLSRGPRLVVLKLGPGGCLWAAEDEVLTSDPIRVEVRDTSGAGDAFDAACVYGLLRGLPARDIARLANTVGAATVAKVGTGTRLPTKLEIVALLKRESIGLSLE